MNDKDRAGELFQLLAAFALESACLDAHKDWSRFAIDVKLEPGSTQVTARVDGEGDVIGNPVRPTRLSMISSPSFARRARLMTCRDG